KKIKQFPLDIIYETLDSDNLKFYTRKWALKNKNKHIIIFLDHIGKVEHSSNDIRIETIKASASLKYFNIDYEATTFGLVQLKKELTDEKKYGSIYHKPNDSLIMESGSIKADSDNLILLWRPDMRFSDISYN